MIVCLCHRVSDRDIRTAVAQGAQDFEAVQQATGAATQCGCCGDCAREVFEEALLATSCVTAQTGGQVVAFPRSRRTTA